VLDHLNPGAILLAGYSPRFHQWAWLHAWRSQRPILFRGETADRAQTEDAIRLRLRSRLLRALYRRCSRFLYIGHNSKEHFASYGCPGERLVFSPYCVDSAPFQVDEEARAKFRPPTRLSLGLNDTDRVVMFSGKLSDRKGPDLLIEAVRSLPEKDRARTTILFLGSGETLPVLEAIANREPRVNVRFLGFQNQKMMSPWFHAADVFVLPSRRAETWGLVVNEALHHGVPCVTSNAVGCTPDLITPGVTGEIFESGSVAALAGALVRARTLGGQIRTREACRARVAAYSVDKAAEGIAKAYESAIS
jgi:glycosyltransferase involved in cell wall biosynthesis